MKISIFNWKKVTFLISSPIKRKKGSMEKGMTLGLGQVIYIMSIL